MKFLVRFVGISMIIVALYNVWVVIDVPPTFKVLATTKVDSSAIVSLGNDAGHGNLLGIQSALNPIHYSNKVTLKDNLRSYLQAANARGLINAKTVIIFPEYIGSWLVAMEQKSSVYEHTNLTDAMTAVITANIFKFGVAYMTAPSGTKDKDKYAAFAMKAKPVAQTFDEIFSELAKEFKVTIVAGSIVLPEPSLDEAGKLKIERGRLYNTSIVYNPEGKIQAPLVKKIFPIDEEAGFTTPGDKNQVPVFTTPAGKLAVLICADSWYPEAYSKLTDDIKMIAVPSLGAVDSVWNAPWNGYNGFKAPSDVDTSDYKKITEGEAWQKYSMGPRAGKAHIPFGMNVFFTGNMWGKKAEGRVLVLTRDALTVLPPTTDTGRIVNQWLY
ncbi:carbon-nitrogen hydrolase family protein [Sediminibacterium sp. TEGAF015]|uniref:carbon-nitrogen hydrolase family protein n=1 Tax=Sediminibacterium sp. TEGAF015 TaxID=575378 RepID=UPI0021FC015B|nr:nitrilase-related carbon-nitrogen hydrolase [Sediminibacterium sp. TEGAF015]BDQ13129.1 carbon-nitrogen hydrolase [Sediminibacterium sp. TEGAF015]